MAVNIYIRKNKGFTLVELIVVIVILAILATIALSAYSTQTASARDSRRKTDISNMVTKINNYLTSKDRYAIMKLVSPMDSRKFSSGSIAGKTVVSSEYNAGTINYASLSVNPTDFKDTDSNSQKDYAFGVTALQGVAYQIASRLEVDDNGGFTNNGAYIVGSYLPRGTSGTANIATGNGTYINTSAPYMVSFSLPNDKAEFFKDGDRVVIVGIPNAIGEVVAVTNRKTVIINASGSLAFSGSQNITLAAPEIEGLIVSEKSGTGIVTDNNGPY